MAASVTYTTINGMLMMENRGGVATAYVPDTLGSLIQCRNSDGTKTYEAFYWPYGEVRSETGTNPSKWGFVGLLGYIKDLANLLYVRARYYKPNLTQWLTVDPQWPVESAYEYAALLPTTYSDSSGLQITQGGLTIEYGRGWEKFIDDLICKLKPDPCKPFPPPVYGNYCGPQGDVPKNCPKLAPADDLDKCCKAHDEQWGKLGCNAANQLWREDCKKRTRALCACMIAANCRNRIGCNIARADLIGIYCRPPFI